MTEVQLLDVERSYAALAELKKSVTTHEAAVLYRHNVLALVAEVPRLVKEVQRLRTALSAACSSLRAWEDAERGSAAEEPAVSEAYRTLLAAAVPDAERTTLPPVEARS